MDRTKLRYSVCKFDNIGNVTRLQRHTPDNRLIDNLQFTYSGNQVIAITDYAGCLDRYDTKEYTDRNTTTNTIEQRYDANGNLITDLDRGIQRIRYNILNLPDTVFFSNGNRIINSYDATGRKWQSQTVTLRESEVMPTDDSTVFDADMQDILFTLYDGSMEYQHPSSRSRRDSLLLCKHIIHNPEGYLEYSYYLGTNTTTSAAATQMPPRRPIVIQTQFYYHRDHLGNNCAVWNATSNSIAQRTWYYTSGTPMPVSTAQGVQPYKYNGKEYIESHGYDTYDYGFRGYYATIGRFTSIDPLTERTPWQSPYTYANNNWIKLIDYAGLFGMDKDAFASNFTVVNKDYKVIYHDDDNGTGVYMWLGDDDFELGENGSIPWGLLDILGWELPYATYFTGMSCLYVTIDIPQGGYGPNTYASAQIMKGNRLASWSDIREWASGLPYSVTLLCALGVESLTSLVVENIRWSCTIYRNRT